MQRDVRDAHLAAVVLEAQHQRAVLGRQSGDASDEGRIAVELDAGGADRGLVVRRADYRGDLALERRLDRGTRGIERGAAMRRRDLADAQLAGRELAALYGF